MAVGIAAVFAAGIYVGGHPAALPGFARDALVGDHASRLLDAALDVISEDYYRPVNRSALVDSGVEGAVAGLHDQYSDYFDPQAYGAFQAASRPQVSGVGIEVQGISAGLLVLQVYPGTPAARAGLRAGDRLVAVGGRSLAHRTAGYSSRLVQGPPGTRVTLTWLDRGRRVTRTLRRARVDLPAVSDRVLRLHGLRLGYVEFPLFTADVHAEVASAVRRQLAGGARGIVLDLRSNGGGLLDEAVHVASLFVPRGIIVSTAGRSRPRHVYRAEGGAIPAGVPLVVLVDHRTASAAEIVTAAIQDHRRGTIMGTHTYGKGVFQEVTPLPNHGALKLTVGEFFTPDGRNLGGGGVREGRGVTPDVRVADDPRTPADEVIAAAERALAARLR